MLCYLAMDWDLFFLTWEDSYNEFPYKLIVMTIHTIKTGAKSEDILGKSGAIQDPVTTDSSVDEIPKYQSA